MFLAEKLFLISLPKNVSNKVLPVQNCLQKLIKILRADNIYGYLAIINTQRGGKNTRRRRTNDNSICSESNARYKRVNFGYDHSFAYHQKK